MAYYFLLRPLLMRFVVSSTFCGHRCVSMRVSCCWRALSVLSVYAGGKCDPSPARAVTQVPEHSLAQSSHLTFLSFMMDSSGTGFSNYPPLKNTTLTLQTNKHTHKTTFSVRRGDRHWQMCLQWQFYESEFVANRAKHLGN